MKNNIQLKENISLNSNHRPNLNMKTMGGVIKKIKTENVKKIQITNSKINDENDIQKHLLKKDTKEIVLKTANKPQAIENKINETIKQKKLTN